jgi:hypothetical protein
MTRKEEVEEEEIEQVNKEMLTRKHRTRGEKDHAGGGGGMQYLLPRCFTDYPAVGVHKACRAQKIYSIYREGITRTNRGQQWYQWWVFLVPAGLSLNF